MRVITMLAKPDPDGVIRLQIPVGTPSGEFEVAVIWHPKVEAPPKSPEELGWPPGYFEQTFGSIDDETFCRPDQGKFEAREAL